VTAERDQGPRLNYVPGLDGIRALAVLAVIAVHQEFTWLPGGFYGVDAFFVLSGFLITSLLVTEWRGSGTIALGRFWARRARRLLPALYVLVIGLGLAAAFWPALLKAPPLMGNALATLFYAGNWYQVAAHSSYFSTTTGASPLLHTWSLAIEEQFYLVWPLVVLAVLRGRRRRPPAASDGPTTTAAGPGATTALVRAVDAEQDRRRRLGILMVIAVAGALTSAAVMAAVSPLSLGPAGQISNRAYYGTDTRAQGLLVGAALALGFAIFGSVRSASGRRVVTGFALAGAAGTVALWGLVPETSALAFHGGFLLAALATAAVIAGVVQAPGGPVPRFLALAPLRALGRISYGVYLWYWPVLLAVTGDRVHLDGFWLFVVRVAVTVAIAALSYRLVEQPIRRGALPSWKGLVAAPVAAGAAVLAMVGASVLPPAAAAPAPLGEPLTASGATSPWVSGAPHTALGAPGPGASMPPATTGAGTGPLRVLLVGDSLAGSLGVGLEQAAQAKGIWLVNEGSPGCSVSMDQLIQVLWYTLGPGPPCQQGNPQALLNQWRTWVDGFNPDVVVYLARGELFNQLSGGAWANVSQTAFGNVVAGRLASGLAVLGSKGASVVVMTAPVSNSGEQPSGAPWPEDAPARVVALNTIIRRVAAAADRPGLGGVGGAPRPRVSVYDLAALVSPNNAYTASVDGVDMRCTDGVHFTAEGGRLVAGQLLPELQVLGQAHHTLFPQGTWPGADPPAVPAWWQKLPCP
jgi:peptidoglycan/LPS O-acetylase OafA/YrhL